MKKLANLKGAKALDRNEQKSINGSGRPVLTPDGPCGETGGVPTAAWQCAIGVYGALLDSDGQCWLCY